MAQVHRCDRVYGRRDLVINLLARMAFLKPMAGMGTRLVRSGPLLGAPPVVPRVLSSGNSHFPQLGARDGYGVINGLFLHGDHTHGLDFACLRQRSPKTQTQPSIYKLLAYASPLWRAQKTFLKRVKGQHPSVEHFRGLASSPGSPLA